MASEMRKNHDGSFKAKVALEALKGEKRDGAEGLLTLKKADVKKAFEQAGFAKEEVSDLTETLWKRRHALIDRYDLENKLVPQGFGKHLEEFKKWGVAAIQDVTGEANGSVWSKELKNSAPSMVSAFEKYVREKINPDGPALLKSIFNSEWSGSSSSRGGAVLKKWAEDRFGVQTTYHGGRDINAAFNDFLAAKHVNAEKIFALLDAEYEFHQYYLRRLHRWEALVLERGICREECSREFKRGLFTGNSVASYTTRSSVFSSQNARVHLKEARVEDIVKTWYQGRDYMGYYQMEAEYIRLGRPRPAERIK